MDYNKFTSLCNIAVANISRYLKFANADVVNAQTWEISPLKSRATLLTC